MWVFDILWSWSTIISGHVIFWMFFFFGWSWTEFGDFVGFWLFSFTGFWIFWSGFFDILWSWSYFSWGEVKYWRKVWIIVVKFRLVLRVFYWWWWRWRRLSLKRESLLFLHGQWSKHRYWCCFLLHWKGFYWCCILILLWCDQCKFGCFLRICVWILLSWAALVSLKKSPKQRMKIKIKIKIKLECELVIDGWVVLRILMDYLMPHALEIYFLLFVCWDN